MIHFDYASIVYMALLIDNHFSNHSKDTGVFESCIRYDLSGKTVRSSDFETALSQRGGMSLKSMKCESIEYDTSEGITSIVTDVRKLVYWSLYRL